MKAVFSWHLLAACANCSFSCLKPERNVQSFYSMRTLKRTGYINWVYQNFKQSDNRRHLTTFLISPDNLLSCLSSFFAFFILCMHVICVFLFVYINSIYVIANRLSGKLITIYLLSHCVDYYAVIYCLILKALFHQMFITKEKPHVSVRYFVHIV